VWRSKHVEPSINVGIINSITKPHLVGISTESSTIHGSKIIKFIIPSQLYMFREMFSPRHQEHLTVFTVSGSAHPSCYRLVSLLMMGEYISRNRYSWLGIINYSIQCILLVIFIVVSRCTDSWTSNRFILYLSSIFMCQQHIKVELIKLFSFWISVARHIFYLMEEPATHCTQWCLRN
jgi:hypothetical protein